MKLSEYKSYDDLPLFLNGLHGTQEDSDERRAAFDSTIL